MTDGFWVTEQRKAAIHVGAPIRRQRALISIVRGRIHAARNCAAGYTLTGTKFAGGVKSLLSSATS